MAKGGYLWNPEHPDQLDDHSAAKHAILRAYVRRYIQVLTKHHAQRDLTLTIVDGFAGGNLYRRGDIIVPGSPGIFLETVRTVEQELAQERQHGFRIDAAFYFIERGRRPRDLLQDSLRAGNFAEELGRAIHVRAGTFEQHADKIIRAIKARRGGMRSLFLLDQYGWGGVPLPLIRRVMIELPNAEVILTFSVDTLINYLTNGTANTDAARDIGLDERTVHSLLEMRERGERALVQHALYEHLRAQVGVPFATPFFLHSRASNRSLWFVHFSRSWRARDEIGQIHWKEAQGFVDHRGDPGFKPLGFTPERLRDPAQLALDFAFDDPAKGRTAQALVNQVPDLIEVLLGEGCAPTLQAIFERYGGATPVTVPLLREHVAQGQDAGELVVQTAEGKERRTGVNLNFDDRVLRKPQKQFHFMRTYKK